MQLAQNLDIEICPHCSVSNPNFEKLQEWETHNFKGTNERVWAAYVCRKCGGIVTGYRPQKSAEVTEIFPSSISESYDFHYLDENVAEDFEEALKCYSNRCYNAFASMCRRTIQSTATTIGVKGQDKVKKQITDLKEIADIDDETYGILEQIIIAGHDGSHPHLPKLNNERAAVLLVLMKDVLNELFVRKAKIKESMSLRKKAIDDQK